MPSFLIARNPDPESRLPFLLRLPVRGAGTIVLACREPWPGKRDAYCHQLDEWPPEAEVVEELPVRSCWRQGAAVHLVLQRKQRRRSIFVWTRKGQRQLIFWRTAITMTAARPGLKVPTARGLDKPLTIAVDVGERYAWNFKGQRATLERRALPVGDYGVFDGAGHLVAAIERKKAGEVASAAVGGTLGLTLADLATLPRALLMIEGRMSDVLKAPGDHVNPGWLMSTLAALQAEHPQVPWIFADNRSLAVDYAYRWLAAAGRIGGSAVSAASGDDGPDRRLGESRGSYDAPEGSSPRSGRAGSAANLSYGTPRQQPLPLDDRQGRQATALANAKAGHEWTATTYAERFGISYSTARSDLESLVSTGALQSKRVGRNIRYVVPED